MARRKWNSRRQLEDLGLSLKIDKKGEYEFYHNGKKKNVINLPCKHKYGKTLEYPAISIYIGSKTFNKAGKEYYKQTYILAHVFVWLWFENAAPVDYDIDHIDNNKLNYHIDNLQLLTHKENIQKRGFGRNQFSAGFTDEEVLKVRAERQAKIDAAAKRKEIRETYKTTIDYINENVKELKAELEKSLVEEVETKKRLIKYLKQKKHVAKSYYEEELAKTLVE